MSLSIKQMRYGISTAYIISILALSGCAVSGSKIQTFPSSEEASVAYDAALVAMDMGQYQAAIKGFKQSISLEPSPFLPHAWLAVAYYSNQHYRQAAMEFKNATEILGGVEESGPLPLMQALSLMRAGDDNEAKELLEILSAPNISTTGVGSYYSGGGTSQGIWKVAAGYLLGNVSEEEYLGKAPQKDLTFPYLIIGINQIVKNDFAEAKAMLTKQIAVSGKGRWSHAMGEAELAWINQKGL